MFSALKGMCLSIREDGFDLLLGKWWKAGFCGQLRREESLVDEMEVLTSVLKYV